MPPSASGNPTSQSTRPAPAYASNARSALGETSASARPCASNCRNPKNVVSSGGATKAPPTPSKPENTPPISPTTVVQPQARVGCPNSNITAPQAVGHSDGDGGEKNSEGEPQDMRVEAGRETGCRVSGNQSRPGYSRRHAHIDAEASLVLRKCPQDIGHHHYQGGALRGLLIHAIEKPE